MHEAKGSHFIIDSPDGPITCVHGELSKGLASKITKLLLAAAGVAAVLLIFM